MRSVAVWLGLAVLVGISPLNASAQEHSPLGGALAGLSGHYRLHGPATSALFRHELREGVGAFSRGEYLQAALAHARAVRESPQHPVANLYLALSMLGLERFDQAVEALERALLSSHRWHDQPIDLRKAFGKGYSKIVGGLETWRKKAANAEMGQFLAIFIGRYSGQFSQARAAYHQFLEKWPKALLRHRGLGRMYEAELSKNGAGSGHRDPYVRGVYLYYNGRYRQAADAFSEAYVQQPSFVMGALFMAHALFASGRYELAARIVIRMVSRDAEQVARKVSLLREFYKNPDKLDEQVSALKQALKKQPSAEAFFLLAYIYYCDGEYPAAQELFTKLDASLGERQAGLRDLARRMGEWTKKQIRGEIQRRKPPGVASPPRMTAKEQKSSASAPGVAVDPGELLERCALHLKKGEYDEAKQRIEAHMRAHQATAMSYFLRARVHLALGEYVFGGIAVRNGLALSGDVSRVTFDWTRFYPSRKAFTAHMKRLDAFVDKEAEKPNARFLAGFVHYYLGSYERALNLFKRNLWLDPNDKHSRLYIYLITKQLEKDGEIK